MADRSKRARAAVVEEPAAPAPVPEEQPPPAGMGWLPDYPDFRDYTPHDPHVEPLLEQMGVADGLAAAPALPAALDLRP